MVTMNSGESYQKFHQNPSRTDPEVSIVHVEGELFFAAADLFYEQNKKRWATNEILKF